MNTARKIALLVCSLASLISCSFSASRTSGALPLPSHSEGGMQLNLVSIGRDIYQIQGEGLTSAVYTTALQSCGYDEKDSIRGATRQLLVGMKDVQIVEQKQIEINDERPWFLHAQATSEGTPVELAAYSVRKGECLFDFALWLPHTSSTPESRAQTRAEFAVITDRYTEYLRYFLPTFAENAS